jgi:hypothetical protein
MSCERPNFSVWDRWSKEARKSHDGAPDPAGTRILRNMHVVRDDVKPRDFGAMVAPMPAHKGKGKK